MTLLSSELLASRAEIVGTYAVFAEIASGSMGTVHLARALGPAGFSRVVAIKRMHRALLGNEDFVAMFVDEARLAARVRHPNVVATLDVVLAGREILVVMDYVHGPSLLRLLRDAGASRSRVPPAVAVAIISDVLRGLHAAHEATSPGGEPLDLVHRDVSPANVLVGVDGIARIMDFGVAKAMGRLYATRDGSIKGKLAYMPPEQLHGGDLDRRVDVYAAGVVLWEALAARPLFGGPDDAETIERALHAPVPPPSEIDPSLVPFDEVVLRALDRDPDGRFETALEMASALEKAAQRAPASEVGAWVETVSGAHVAERARVLDAVERAHVEALAAPAPNAVRPHVAPRPRARGALLAVAALVVVAAGARASRRSPVAPAPPVPAATAAPEPATPSVEPVPPAPSSAIPDSPQARSAPVPPPPVRMDPKRAPSRPQPARPRPSVDCAMPFAIDSEGHKHFKPECAP